jgi:poly(A) polymerase
MSLTSIYFLTYRIHDFFSFFLASLRQQSCVSQILSIPDAYTPVIKFFIDAQSVDLVFCSLHVKQLPKKLDILDLQYLRGLDNPSVRSLNGARVAEWLLRIIPNLHAYRNLLRVVKHWARCRGLYSNVLGIYCFIYI